MARTPSTRGRGSHLYHQVYTVIREWIVAGKIGVGDPLPGENVLAERFGVARVTIRNAIAKLREEGLVEKRHGSGTFVAEALAAQTVVRASMADVLRHIREVGRGTQVRLLAVDDVGVPAPLRSVFVSESSLRRIVRVRSIHGEPIFHVVTYIPQEIAGRFSREDLQDKPMLQLLGALGIQLESGHQVVGAAVADPNVAGILDLEVGEPLLSIRRVHRDHRKRVVEYVEMLASSRRFELHMELDPDGLWSENAGA